MCFFMVTFFLNVRFVRIFFNVRILRNCSENVRIFVWFFFKKRFGHPESVNRVIFEMIFSRTIKKDAEDTSRLVARVIQRINT